MLTKKNKVIFLIITTIILFGNTVNVEGYVTDITISYGEIVIDISRSLFQSDFVNFEGNLTLAENNVTINTDSIPDLNLTTALFISQPNAYYNTTEKAIIKSFLELGDRTLFIGGDSDYAGYFTPIYANDLLIALNSSLRIGADSVSDTVYNDDGAAYRVIAPAYGNGTIANIIKQDCTDGILMHAPTSVLGYNGTDIIDLRYETLENVEVLLHYSEYAVCQDSDVSETIYDFYEIGDVGLMPAVVCEKLVFGDNVSYIIVAGEVIFADYKKMYDQITPNGLTHYGQMFCDNIVSFFLENGTFPPIVSEYQEGLTIILLSSLIFSVYMVYSISRKKKY